MSCDFIALANSGVQKLTPYQPGKPESELRRELGLELITKLASNENPLGPTSTIVSALAAEAGQLARYPDGNGFALKSALAEFYAVDTAQITLGNGSNDILELLARAYLQPGLNAVFSQHAFAVYPLAVQAVGAEGRAVAANAADHDQPYGHDLDAMLSMVDENTRLLFVANPNNPTGTWLTEAELRPVLDRVPEHVIVVLDEAYAETADVEGYPDSLKLLQEYPNLVVTRTFSKAYGLAGLRVGYSLSHPDIADVLNRVRQPFNVNSMAQACAVAALADQKHIAAYQQLNSQGLVELQAACEQRGLATLPSAGNFLAIDCGRPAEAVFADLLKLGVIVRPIANYGLPNFIRVTVGLPEENSAFLTALDKVLA